MSMRNRRALRLRPVNSLKHIIDASGLLSLAVASNIDIVATVLNPDFNTSPTQCNVGSRVSSIYLRVEVVGVTAAAGVDQIYMALVKNPGSNMTFPVLDQLGVDDLRKYVLHEEMIMLTPFVAAGTSGFPRTMFKGVIRVPKGYQRNGVKDKLVLILQHSTGESSQTSRFCIQCIYKEYQ